MRERDRERKRLILGENNDRKSIITEEAWLSKSHKKYSSKTKKRKPGKHKLPCPSIL